MALKRMRKGIPRFFPDLETVGGRIAEFSYELALE